METPLAQSDSAERAPLAVRAARVFAAYRDGAPEVLGDLVDLLTPLLWHTARAQGCDGATAEDVVQTAWLRLVESSDTIREPAAVLGWMVTTAKRESWRALGRPDLKALASEVPQDRPDDTPQPDATLVLTERQRILWRHIEDMNARCRELLRVIAFADKPDYATLSEALGMPVGSIGPTRGRCLTKLRESLLADARWAG